ncbi:chemotaxis protein CheA [Limnoglobus roseus]|uniref:chemotaxis protein CheA n=1 Tax=Limnoglobus roseus TaxID=2598579 RepID=UPI001FECA2EF|nr:chemotaxis protein CheA [Limnoglobus roseus]
MTFSPAPDVAARGVDVNVVRSRLQAVGEILHAEPKSVAGGLQFLFVLAVNPAADFTGWPADNIRVEPYSPAAELAEVSDPGQTALPLTSVNLVRVDLARLDDIMRSLGEMVLTRARLENSLGRAAQFLPPGERRDLEETVQGLDRQLRDLREGVMRVRLVPIRDLFSRMRLVVRDLTRETGKDIDLVVSGEETEIDKFVVERLADPLLHLVRNAVSHGLESAADRVAAGKPPRGRLALRAAAVGGTIVLEVEDDGRGVQFEAVFARARSAGLIAVDATTDPMAVLDLICAPGFSTRDEVDRGSGRGVGLDVARRAIEQGLAGSLTLDSRQGAGTRFTARLPLTLIVADVLTVSVGGQTYAVPQTVVREVIPVEAGSTIVLENNELIRHHGGVLPLLRLDDLFHHPRPVGSYVALVVGDGTSAMALAVDRAVGMREVVVRPLTDLLVQAPGIGGATELGDGRPVLILDPAGLARYNRRRVAGSPVRAGGLS